MKRKQEVKKKGKWSNKIRVESEEVDKERKAQEGKEDVGKRKAG